MSTLDRSKPNRQTRIRQVIAGVKKHFAKGPLQLGGQTFATPDDLVMILQKDIDTIDATDSAHAIWREKVDAQKASRTTVQRLLKFLRQQVVGLHGDSPGAAGTLADFGFTPRPVKPVPVADKATATAKRAATRKARNTMGKVQRKAIKGSPAPATVPAPPGPVPGDAHPTPSATPLPAPARSTTTTTTST